MRTIRYKEIAADLRSKISDGELPPRSLMSSESELCRTYSASRATIRRALEELRSDGLVESRQGYGWLVAAMPLTQTLGQLDTIENQLAEAGKSSQREVLSFGFVEAPPDVAAVLGTGEVLEVRRLSLAENVPFALVSVWCPRSIASRLSLEDVERASFLEQLDVELGGATQTIGADIAGPGTASLLGVPESSPILIARRTTYAATGEPVLLSHHRFPAHLTEFAVELPVVASGATVGGLRLVR